MDVFESMTVATRWLIIGLWTLAVALLPTADDDWVPMFCVIGGFVTAGAVVVLLLCTIG